MVEEFKDRKAVVVSWEAGDYDGPVKLELSSENDRSSTALNSNPGYAAVTYPLDHSGQTHVRVLDEEGNLIDEGDIDVE